MSLYHIPFEKEFYLDKVQVIYSHRDKEEEKRKTKKMKRVGYPWLTLNL